MPERNDEGRSRARFAPFGFCATGSRKAVVGQFEIGHVKSELLRYKDGMSAKDRYSWNLKCPTCGRQGEVHVSENDHPYAPPETRVTSISEGFSVQRAGGTATDTVLICVKCGEVAG